MLITASNGIVAGVFVSLVLNLFVGARLFVRQVFRAQLAETDLMMARNDRDQAVNARDFANDLAAQWFTHAQQLQAELDAARIANRQLEARAAGTKVWAKAPNERAYKAGADWLGDLMDQPPAPCGWRHPDMTPDSPGCWLDAGHAGEHIFGRPAAIVGASEAT